MSTHQRSEPRVLVSYHPFHPTVEDSSVRPFRKCATFDRGQVHLICNHPNSPSAQSTYETLSAVHHFNRQEKLSHLLGHATYLVLSTFRLYPSETPLYLNDVPACSPRLLDLYDYIALHWRDVPILLHLGGNDAFAPNPPSLIQMIRDYKQPGFDEGDSRPIPPSDRTFASLRGRFRHFYAALKAFIKDHKIRGVLLDVQEYGTDAMALATLLTQLKRDFGYEFIISFVLDVEDLRCCSLENKECVGSNIIPDSAQSSHSSSKPHLEDLNDAEAPKRRRNDLCVREVERCFSSLNGGQKVDFFVVRFAGRIALRQLKLNLKNYGNVCASVQDWCHVKRIVAGLAHMHGEDAADAGGMRDEVALLAQWYRNEFGGIAGGIDGGAMQRDSEEDIARREETVLWAKEMRRAIGEALEEHHNDRE